MFAFQGGEPGNEAKCLSSRLGEPGNEASTSNFLGHYLGTTDHQIRVSTKNLFGHKISFVIWARSEDCYSGTK